MYSSGMFVIYPLSLVNWLVLVGIVGLFWTLFQSTLSATPPLVPPLAIFLLTPSIPASILSNLAAVILSPVTQVVLL